MAAKKKAASVGAGAVAAGKAAKDNAYVQRLIEDDELRDNLRTAYESARKAYGRMSNGKGPQAALNDKKTQKQLREAATSSRTRPTRCAARARSRSSAAAAWFCSRRRRPGARAQRGPAQEGARHPLRRRGGVRVHEPTTPSTSVREFRRRQRAQRPDKEAPFGAPLLLCAQPGALRCAFQGYEETQRSHSHSRLPALAPHSQPSLPRPGSPTEPDDQGERDDRHVRTVGHAHRHAKNVAAGTVDRSSRPNPYPVRRLQADRQDRRRRPVGQLLDRGRHSAVQQPVQGAGEDLARSPERHGVHPRASARVVQGERRDAEARPERALLRHGRPGT